MEDLKATLAPNIKKFISLRDTAGVDINDIFINDFLDSILFPDADRSAQTAAFQSTDAESGAGRAWLGTGVLLGALVGMLTY